MPDKQKDQKKKPTEKKKPLNASPNDYKKLIAQVIMHLLRK